MSKDEQTRLINWVKANDTLFAAWLATTDADIDETFSSLTSLHRKVSEMLYGTPA